MDTFDYIKSIINRIIPVKFYRSHFGLEAYSTGFNDGLKYAKEHILELKNYVTR